MAWTVLVGESEAEAAAGLKGDRREGGRLLGRNLVRVDLHEHVCSQLPAHQAREDVLSDRAKVGDGRERPGR